MSPGAANRTHPDAQTIAAFAEGALKRAEIPAVLAHLDGCPSCMATLADANLHLGGSQEGKARRWPWLLAAAAVVIVLALSLTRGRIASGFGARSGMPRLVTLASGGERTVEPRLSGGFLWKTYRAPLRASEEEAGAERLKLAGMAGELVETAQREGTPGAQHDAGVALLLVDEPLEAVRRLRIAAETSGGDAKNWSDLAAGLYTMALRQGRPSLYPEGLAAADRALQLDPAFPEALFNRALILERLGLVDQAREAWERAIAVEPSSPWAGEARAHLTHLPRSTAAMQFQRDQPRLEEAAKEGDATTVRALVVRYPQQARTWAEFEYLSRWAEALQRGEAAVAARELSGVRTIAGALATVNGEALLGDAVGAIDVATPSRRAAIADAQLLYKRGRVAYSKQKPAEGEVDLRRAAARFAEGGSPMALVARYYAANTRFDQNDARGARLELDRLVTETDARPHYLALGAETRWEMGLCRIVDEDWPGALAFLTPAYDTFARLGERNHLGFLETLLATTLVSYGRLDDGWAARIRSFRILSEEAHGDRLAVSIGAAARVEVRAGRLDGARAILHVEEAVARAAGNDTLLANMLVRQVVLSAYLGDDAASALREARVVAARIVDPTMRSAAFADVQFAEGAGALNVRPAAAVQALDGAIEFYRAAAKSFPLTESYLLRGRARLRLGNRDEALRDFQAGIDTVERYPLSFGGSATGLGVIDASQSLFEEAMRLHLDRGNLPSAFACAERARSDIEPGRGDVVSLDELRRRLAGSGSIVLELAVLPEEVVAMRVSAEGAAAVRRPIARAELDRLVARAAANDEASSRALYDLLIRPFDADVAVARQVIIVPAPELEVIPYAALYDSVTRRFLVESAPLALAATASSLVRGTSTQPHALLALALPSGRPVATVALAESERELSDLRSFYRHEITLSGAQATLGAFVDALPHADVVHIASHTEQQPGGGELALVFPSAPGQWRRIAWSDIAAMPVANGAIVTLAACGTLRRPGTLQTRALSLGGGFLAAGAADVVGTLGPIADDDARALFREIHRQLAAGVDVAVAVQRVQLAAMHSGSSWRAVALMTGRIPHSIT